MNDSRDIKADAHEPRGKCGMCLQDPCRVTLTYPMGSQGMRPGLEMCLKCAAEMGLQLMTIADVTTR